MAEQPIPAVLGGGFDVGDAVDGVFGVPEAPSASVEVGGGASPLLLEAVQVTVLSLDLTLGVVDGVAVGAVEEASPGVFGE